MKRTKLTIGALAACAAMMAAGPHAIAQQSSQQAGEAGRTQGERDQDRGRQQKNRSKQNAERKQGRQANNKTGQSGQAISHFLAGYYAGYTDGWVDGADELVIGVVNTQRQQAQQRADRGQSPDKMQSGRRNARDQMRERMRADTQGSRAGSNSQASAVSFSGEVTAMKTVPVKNTNIEHRVVRLKTDSGDHRIVDLGPKPQTQKLQIQKGDEIAVSGVPVMSGDFRILAARQVAAGDQTVKIQYKKLNLNDRESEVSAQSRSQRNKSDHSSNKSDHSRTKSRSDEAHESRSQ